MIIIIVLKQLSHQPKTAKLIIQKKCAFLNDKAWSLNINNFFFTFKCYLKRDCLFMTNPIKTFLTKCSMTWLSQILPTWLWDNSLNS